MAHGPWHGGMAHGLEVLEATLRESMGAARASWRSSGLEVLRSGGGVALVIGATLKPSRSVPRCELPIAYRPIAYRRTPQDSLRRSPQYQYPQSLSSYVSSRYDC